MDIQLHNSTLEQSYNQSGLQKKNHGVFYYNYVTVLRKFKFIGHGADGIQILISLACTFHALLSRFIVLKTSSDIVFFIKKVP